MLVAEQLTREQVIINRKGLLHEIAQGISLLSLEDIKGLHLLIALDVLDKYGSLPNPLSGFVSRLKDRVMHG